MNDKMFAGEARDTFTSNVSRASARSWTCKITRVFALWLALPMTEVAAHNSSEPSHSHFDVLARTLVDAGSAFFIAIPAAALLIARLRKSLNFWKAAAITATLCATGLWLYLFHIRQDIVLTWITIAMCLSAWPILIWNALHERQNAR